ncbi:2OG-Fe(II) oxygenase [Streptomyces yaanensis]|uniref:2OG-Fe(II) oxygenase n=1 Tax=Streptomyces yaanensis TaxID=1142239 RepID=A0ABV7SP08_9ACTN|nr:2OG-Fe(II) oxygenase [Streptomyces sp. CGMCC 4.7035]WNB97200.1 2OG-Fe(II) oxygenase [Streptomyces sp. CGMCC 4.7035]
MDHVDHALRGRFSWTTFDVTSLLPAGWDTDIAEVVRKNQADRLLMPPHSTSREQVGTRALLTSAVRGAVVWKELSWVVDLYHGLFRELGESHARRTVLSATDRRYAVVLNVQEPGGDRSECHIDTNPIAGLLYATGHRPGAGGELAIAHDTHARNTADVDRDCSVIYPQKGHLVFFDGRLHPHYVRAVTSGGARVVVAMNYYTEECPESMRPGDLDDYLHGSPVG